MLRKALIALRSRPIHANAPSHIRAVGRYGSALRFSSRRPRDQGTERGLTAPLMVACGTIAA
ncbi:MAG: hypothetical protein M0Z28_21535 [Rhodospirillales bacterium]|nr:hypothetical protein [Rhodospirillales bacterium]